RRYCAKLAYELELHEGGHLDRMREVYARRLSDAIHVDWPGATWLSDVDPFFYAARYLRAWAFETHLRALLRERFGERWFAEPDAGAVLREWWSRGQAMDADELLGELTGARLDFSVLLEDLAVA
ncbi:MAG: peptidase M3, partial [Thermoleophilaceae bacterium]